jgi:hypothetical protein
VGHQHGFGVGTVSQRSPQPVHVDRFAEGKAQRDDLGAVDLSDLAETVPEHPDGGVDYLVARGEGIDDSGLHCAGAGGGQNPNVSPRFVHLLQTVRDAEEHLFVLRPPVVDHRGRHLRQNVVRHGDGTGDSQVHVCPPLLAD